MATKDKDGVFGFDELMSSLDQGEFDARMKVAFTKAQHRIGLTFVAQARDNIKARKFHHNEESTIERKGSSLPLVDGGDLFGSITYDVPGPKSVFLGINSPLLANGRPLYDVLHNGATMRRGGNVWVIPPRPFMSIVWEDLGFVQKTTNFYLDALGESLQGRP